MIWLIDTSYVAYRSFFSMPALGENAVMFGAARVATQIYDMDPQATMVWCFDVGEPKRTRLDPEYKKPRKEKRPKHEGIDGFYKSLTKFRTIQLEEMGFNHILWEKGYEADDIIASICKDPRCQNRIINIVSADHDLYQLLREEVLMYKLKTGTFYTVQHFKEEFGINPSEWSKVKAIAGCNSDNVKGIKGVGEKKAIAFLTNKLKETTKAYQAIRDGKQQCLENFKLVDLPLEGTPSYVVGYDTVDTRRANQWLKDNSIRDLRFS